MRTEIASAPEPACSARKPPDEREVLVHQPVLEILRAHVTDFADPARFDQPARQRNAGTLR